MSAISDNPGSSAWRICESIRIRYVDIDVHVVSSFVTLVMPISADDAVQIEDYIRLNATH
jgi:hypothetical protein